MKKHQLKSGTKFLEHTVRAIHEETHEKEQTDEKPDFHANSPILGNKADEWESEECGDKGRNGHDEHPLYAEPSQQFGKEEGLECAGTCPIETHDVADARRVKAHAAHFNGHVEEKWEDGAY